MRTGVVVYDGLPISSGGAHHLRSGNPRWHFERMLGFLESCAAPVSPVSFGLVLLHPRRLSEPWSREVHKRATREFGKALPGVISPDLHSASWSLGLEQVSAAFDLLERSAPDPRPYDMDALSVRIGCSFKVLDPDSGEVLPFQGPEVYPQQQWLLGQPFGRSMLAASLSGASTCRLHLCLPFEEVDPDVRRVACALQEHLPFKLSPKHWSLYRLNKKATGFYGRKTSVL